MPPPIIIILMMGLVGVEFKIKACGIEATEFVATEWVQKRPVEARLTQFGGFPC